MGFLDAIARPSLLQGEDEEEENLAPMRRRVNPQTALAPGNVQTQPTASSADVPNDALSPVTAPPIDSAIPGMNPEGPAAAPPAPVPQLPMVQPPLPTAALSPTNAVSAPTGPTTPDGSYATALKPYWDKVHATNSALQQQLDKFSHLHYEAPHHGIGYRIAEGLVSALSPAAGNAIFERGDERKRQGFEAQLQEGSHNVSAFQNAAKDALEELREQRETQFEQQRGNYYQHLAEKEPTVPPPPDIHRMYAGAMADAQKRGVDPSKDPAVIQLGDAITSLQRQPQDRTETPFSVWRQQNPKAAVGDYFKLQPEARAEFRPPVQTKELTKYQRAELTLAMEREVAKEDNKLDSGEVTPEAHARIVGRIRSIYQNELGSVPPAGGTSPAVDGNGKPITGPKMGDTNSLNGVPYKYDGKKWVKQNAGSRRK